MFPNYSAYPFLLIVIPYDFPVHGEREAECGEVDEEKVSFLCQTGVIVLRTMSQAFLHLLSSSYKMNDVAHLYIAALVTGQLNNMVIQTYSFFIHVK